jgi:hypothetical protein
MKSDVDFNKLWRMTLTQVERIQNPRYKALLMNHEHNKEKVCRKLGIVSPPDVIRFISMIENSHK